MTHHEARGHCRVCHVDVRLVGSCWLHVCLPLLMPGHTPDVVVDCCETHGKEPVVGPDQLVLHVDPPALPEVDDDLDDEDDPLPEAQDAGWYAGTWPHRSWRPSIPPGPRNRGGRR